MQVYVLLFSVGGDSEGIHTLKIENRNVVLIFEGEDDATRFGLMLEAQDFPSPRVEAIDREEIEEICQDFGYDYRVVPEGTLEMPPEKVLDKFDWDPEKPMDYPSQDKKSQDVRDLASESPTLSDSELEAMRQRLEKLL